MFLFVELVYKRLAKAAQAVFLVFDFSSVSSHIFFYFFSNSIEIVVLVSSK